jgi:anti-sigma factor RsiW
LGSGTETIRIARSLEARSGPGIKPAARRFLIQRRKAAGLRNPWRHGFPLDRPEIPAAGEAVLAGHLRGLAAPQPFDIASSDRHVVKPWFNGRTTIAPDAPDLADQGFPLVGGRIDIVGGAPVPTLVYRKDRHVISVTVVPAADGAGPGEERRDGSTIERWRIGDLTYWVVSDLNLRDLRAFVDLFRSRTGRPG